MSKFRRTGPSQPLAARARILTSRRLSIAIPGFRPARILSLIVPAALALALGGCEITAANAIYGLVEGSSLNQTGKTASDHLVSTITGQDCNILRYQQTGKYCLSSAELAQIDAAERRDNSGYCYRTLAQVTCYTQPDPTASPEVRVH